MGSQSFRASKHPTESRLVTILVALYKSGEFVESKIASLKQQTIDDAWIVFLNCQNLHNELEACERYAAENPNVINIVFNDHTLLYDTWNVGIQHTQSKYIVNYNADDQWHPAFLERCTTQLELHQNVGILSTGVLITHKPNQVWPNWQHHDRMPFYPYPQSSAGPCPMWRRELHAKYGHFGSYRVIGDARFWEKLHAGGETFGLIPDDLVLYYMSGASLERRRDDNGKSFRDLDMEQPNT